MIVGFANKEDIGKGASWHATHVAPQGDTSNLCFSLLTHTLEVPELPTPTHSHPALPTERLEGLISSS